jgi:hypothetical protein
MHIQAGLFLPSYGPEKHRANSNTKFPFRTVYYMGVRRLTTSFYIVYDYTTGGHTEF